MPLRHLFEEGVWLDNAGNWAEPLAYRATGLSFKLLHFHKDHKVHFHKIHKIRFHEIQKDQNELFQDYEDHEIHKLHKIHFHKDQYELCINFEKYLTLKGDVKAFELLLETKRF